MGAMAYIPLVQAYSRHLHAVVHRWHAAEKNKMMSDDSTKHARKPPLRCVHSPCHSLPQPRSRRHIVNDLTVTLANVVHGLLASMPNVYLHTRLKTVRAASTR